MIHSGCRPEANLSREGSVASTVTAAWWWLDEEGHLTTRCTSRHEARLVMSAAEGGGGGAPAASVDRGPGGGKGRGARAGRPEVALPHSAELFSHLQQYKVPAALRYCSSSNACSDEDRGGSITKHCVLEPWVGDWGLERLGSDGRTPEVGDDSTSEANMSQCFGRSLVS